MQGCARIVLSLVWVLALIACGGGESLDEPADPADREFDFSTRTYLVNVVSGASFVGSSGSLSMTYRPVGEDETTIAANVILGQSRLTSEMSWRGTDPNDVTFTLRDGFNNEALVASVTHPVVLDDYDFYLVGVGQVDNLDAIPLLQVLQRLDVDAQVRLRLMHGVVNAADQEVDIYDAVTQTLVVESLTFGQVSEAYALTQGVTSFSFIVTEAGVAPDYLDVTNNLWFGRADNLELGAHLLYFYDTAASWAQWGRFYEDPLAPR